MTNNFLYLINLIDDKKFYILYFFKRVFSYENTTGLIINISYRLMISLTIRKLKKKN